MAKVIPIHSEPLIYSIALKHAVYCENSETISNSRPHRCGVCAVRRFCALNPFSTAIRTHPHMPVSV
jgi:hypothetical protein